MHIEETQPTKRIFTITIDEDEAHLLRELTVFAVAVTDRVISGNRKLAYKKAAALVEDGLEILLEDIGEALRNQGITTIME